MKLSRLWRALSDWAKPRPAASRATHTAYPEVFHNTDATFYGRIYAYEGSGVVLEEFWGVGDRATAAKAVGRLMRKYRRDE